MTYRLPSDFSALVQAIVRVHEGARLETAKAINVALTLRNWLIGAYIAEYELRGKDRAAYGERLLDELSAALGKRSVSASGRRQLYEYLSFYRAYPQIVRTLSAQSRLLLPRSLAKKVRTPSAQLPSRRPLDRLSYSHFVLLAEMDDSAKRAFYELECVRGNWSFRELKRQIASLYYERVGLSKDKKKLSGLTQARAQRQEARELIRDPYVFEFLGLRPKEVMGESDLEDTLLDKLEAFLLELGHGFCFEARQKRITIGGEHFFVDLVFYHRILKCHVLVELKLGGFNHEHLGQLNTYVSWFRAHEMAEGDSPPVGILLCTKKNQALVEYALAGIDNPLFVSKYQLELPKKDDIRRFIEKEIERA